MSSSVCGSAASVCLSSLSKLLRLTSESTLVTARISQNSNLSWFHLHLAIVCSREWASVVLQFDNRSWCFSGHVMDRILISQPIRSLDGIVHMPSPIVLVHVPQSGIDTSLCSYSVTSGWEELRYTGSVETSFGKTEGCSQTSSTGTDDNRIVLMVLFIHQICHRKIFSYDVHTTTGYRFPPTNDGASFARRGACVMIRAG